ncbi:MAG TPA: hypothetical protein VN306_14410 [Mycobacterium sp.]|nr:hypothetical protein [Mycobacterium sp.]
MTVHGTRGLQSSEGTPALIPDPVPNMMARPYGCLSVQEVDVALTEPSLRSLLLGREVYWQTDYLALRRGDDVALVAVRKASTTDLCSPVVELRVLAEPHRVAWIASPTTDVGNPTALALAALGHARRGVRAYLVQGRFEHVNFIWEPALTRVRVSEVVPPRPPKLFAMTQEVVAFDEDLPPIELVLDAVDLLDLASDHPADRYLLPCRGSGVQLRAPVEFLDTRPAVRRDWLLIGCEQSRRLHRHFYGDEPKRIDICPRRRIDRGDRELGLFKCCLRERGIEVGGHTAVVPWGANLDEIRSALRILTGVDPPQATRAVRQRRTRDRPDRRHRQITKGA